MQEIFHEKVDVSLPLTPETPVWPGDPQMQLDVVVSLREGGPYQLTRLVMSSHMGTHVDAPAHVIEQGGGVERIPLARLMGPARVVEFEGAGNIRAQDLDTWFPGSRILLKTRNSNYWRSLRIRHRQAAPPNGFGDFIGLCEDAARYLVECGVVTVGIDGPSIDPPDDEGLRAHHTLLDAGIAVIECLDLSEVGAGDWYLCCLPLRIPGGDGAPARVVLMR